MFKIKFIITGWSGLAMILYCAICAGISGMCLAKSWLILEERYPEYREGLTRKPFSTIGYHAYGKVMRYTDKQNLKNPTKLTISFLVHLCL